MPASSLLPNYERDGLALLPAPEAEGLRLPADHGALDAELAAAESGAALVDATAAGAVEVDGADAPELLHRLLAGDVRALEPGRAAPNLLLSSKGRVRFAFDVERGLRALRLVTAPGQAAALAAALEQYVFAEAVGLTDASERVAPLELVGPRAATVVAAALGGAELAALAPDGWTELSFGAERVRVTRTRVLGAPGWRLDAGPATAPRLWSALQAAGATPMGLQAREVLRVARRVPLAGAELPAAEEAAPYPQEAGLEHAFSLAKGCYVGQEVVAKLDTYGGLNRALRAFGLPDSAHVAPGTALTSSAGADAGVVTTVAGTRLLAYLKLRRADEGPFRAGLDGPELTPLEPLGA